VLPVSVPTTAREPELVPEDGDELRSRLHQPPGGVAALPEDRHAVAVAKAEWLAGHVKGVAEATGPDQVVRHLPVLREAAYGFAPAPGVVELLEERLA
jgi:hypothetical protein